MDVDGVLTDGGVYILENGEAHIPHLILAKKENIR